MNGSKGKPLNGGAKGNPIRSPTIISIKIRSKARCCFMEYGAITQDIAAPKRNSCNNLPTFSREARTGCLTVSRLSCNAKGHFLSIIHPGPERRAEGDGCSLRDYPTCVHAGWPGSHDDPSADAYPDLRSTPRWLVPSPLDHEVESPAHIRSDAPRRPALDNLHHHTYQRSVAQLPTQDLHLGEHAP